MAAAEAAPMGGDKVIEVKGLTRRYGEAVAVDAIDLDIRRGEIFGLLGPNGAGKTTTILMLLGLTEASSGTINVLGFDPLRQPLEVKRRVGYLPDSVGFYDGLSARENLRYTGRLMGLRRAEIDGRIDGALERVHLADVARKPVGTYSRGMRQRLGIAEILMKRAEIAILDEPTSGLDPHATHELLDMIRTLKHDGVAVLLSSHLLDRVQSICDRVALFNKGRIALVGTIEDLGKEVLGEGSTIDVEASGVDLEAMARGLTGLRKVERLAPDHVRVSADSDVSAEVAQKVVASGGRLLRLAAVQPSLDSIYTTYFQGARNAA
jgi:ABC-2 type transport system ATP-binding protein